MPRRSALPVLVLAPLALSALTVVGGVPTGAATAQPTPSAIAISTVGSNDRAPLPEGPLAQVATGYWSTYALTLDGQVLAAGSDYGGALDVPGSLADKDVVQIAAGYRHGLALDADGDVTSWGWLDDATSIAATVPQEVQDATVVQVDAGGNQDLALTDDGQVIAWGLSNGRPAAVPAEVASLEVAQVVAGPLSSAVLTTDGKVFSWGFAGPAPAALDSETVVAVATGDFTAMALTADGDLVGWGEDYYGLRDVPQAVQDGDVVSFDLSSMGAIAATSDGAVTFWGEAEERNHVPSTTGQPVADVQLDRYRTTIVYATLPNTELPTVSGDAVVGSTLTVDQGSWLELPDAYAYQWLSDGEPVGTDQPSYTPTAGDLGNDVTVRVTARAGSVTGQATSEPVTVAAAQFLTRPRVRLSGTPRVGSTLRMSAIDATPAPDLSFRGWYRDGRFFENHDRLTYRLTPADRGHLISVAVWNERAGYATDAAFSQDLRIGPGAARLTVGAPASIRRGADLRVRVGGLVARERYTVRLGNTVLSNGRADARGRAVRTVELPRGVRAGRQTLVVTGSYADRTGRRTVTVTR